MTGFGRADAGGEGTRFEVEVRGVNHRFLEIRVRLPQELSPLEPELREAVGRHARRGRVEVWVEQTRVGEPEAHVSINRQVATGYLEAAGELAREFKLSGSLEVQALLALPGTVRVDFTRPAAGDQDKRSLIEALQGALGDFEAARVAEGGKLAEDLRARLRTVESEMARVSAAAARSQQETLEKLRARMSTLLEGIGLDPTRLAQEAAYLAGRSDIAEELVRLAAHVGKFHEFLASAEGPVGKSLDFLVQEMHREVNTIASKSETLEISQSALAMKAEVERIREQVQNLE
jgi:uncharacterized protein (TIGR00255 family)